MVINTQKKSQISVEIMGQDIIESITSLNDLNKNHITRICPARITLFKNLKAKDIMVITDRAILVNN